MFFTSFCTTVCLYTRALTLACCATESLKRTWQRNGTFSYKIAIYIATCYMLVTSQSGREIFMNIMRGPPPVQWKKIHFYYSQPLHCNRSNLTELVHFVKSQTEEFHFDIPPLFRIWLQILYSRFPLFYLGISRCKVRIKESVTSGYEGNS